MDVPTVMAIIGGIALLLGVFGGGVKAKEIEFPRLNGRNRIFSTITGIVLLTIAALLSGFEHTPRAPSTPTEIPPTQIPLTPTEIPPTKIASSITTQVDATLSWQDTGVTVQEAERISITYISGLWTFDRNISPTDGTGTPGYINAQAPIPSANLGALVAKIEDGLPFLVGNQVSLRSDRIGTIFLRINDTEDISDNEGSIAVQITVSP